MFFFSPPPPGCGGEEAAESVFGKYARLRRLNNMVSRIAWRAAACTGAAFAMWALASARDADQPDSRVKELLGSDAFRKLEGTFVDELRGRPMVRLTASDSKEARALLVELMSHKDAKRRDMARGDFAFLPPSSIDFAGPKGDERKVFFSIFDYGHIVFAIDLEKRKHYEVRVTPALRAKITKVLDSAFKKQQKKGSPDGTGPMRE
jgi:hypothetical protein